MAAFFRGKPSGNYTYLIEVGSGSVGMAIIDHRQPTEEGMRMTIWSHREYATITDETNINERLKRVISILMNEFLTAGATGFKALREHDPSGHVRDIIVSIAAPWSYTATQTIEYEQPAPFAVTASLIEDLGDSASNQIMEIAEESAVFASTEARILGVTVQGAIINDYLVTDFDGTTKTDILSLIHTTSLAPKVLVDAINEGIDKIIPHKNVTMTPFMMSFYSTIVQHQKHVKEFALIDVTSEATEIGIVRNGALMTAVSVPFGSYTMAREIAGITKLTLEEAHSLLRMEASELTSQPAEVVSALEDVRASYATNLASMFEETKDELFIPHSIYLMADEELTPFLNLAVKSIGSASKLHFTTHPFTHKFFTQPVGSDPALSLLAATITER